MLYLSAGQGRGGAGLLTVGLMEPECCLGANINATCVCNTCSCTQDLVWCLGISIHNNHGPPNRDSATDNRVYPHDSNCTTECRQARGGARMLTYV